MKRNKKPNVASSDPVQAQSAGATAPGKRPRSASLPGKPVQRRATSTSGASASSAALNQDEGFLSAMGYVQFLEGAGGGAAEGAVPRLEDPSVEPEMLDAHKRDPNVAYEDFSESGTLYVDGVSPDDVIQTNINDCYLVSVLASLASNDPDFVRGMIRVDGPGQYSVRLHEKKDDGTFAAVWIAVSASLPSSGGVPYYGHSEGRDADGKQELWPSIIEKAYAKLKGNYPDIDWGNTIYAYEALFGTAGDKSTTGSLDADTQWEELKTAVDNNEAVVCSTGRHVITVLSYSESGGTRQVTVRDQAQAGGGRDGRETITFDQFRTRYTYFRHTAATTTE